MNKTEAANREIITVKDLVNKLSSVAKFLISKWLIIFLFGAIAILVSCKGNDSVEIGQKTSMFVETVYNAGEVVKGEVITARIIVKNTGDYPLVIAAVQPSCSCTVAEKPEDPIAPGEEGEIVTRVDTYNLTGSNVNKQISIVANTEPSITEVFIKAKMK